MRISLVWKQYDVLVVGSGGAGSNAAETASEMGASVLVVTKDPLSASDTKISEGIATVRASGSEDDTEDTLSENLLLAGGDLPDANITSAFARDSQMAYDKVRANGLRPKISAITKNPDPLPLPMGGHTKRRSIGHKNSGVAFGHANWNSIVKDTKIDYKEDCWLVDIITGNNKDDTKSIVGALIYDAQRGELLAVVCASIVVASGGLSTIYFPKTDTMRGNTGDSYAIAARAGAELVDMEQIQFLPFCLTSPPAFEGLLGGEPVTASYLGVLRDKNKKVILDGVYLRTRAECSAAIMKAVEDGRGTKNGGAYLDMTANKRAPKSGVYFMNFLKGSLPSAYNNVRQAMSKSEAQCEDLWEVRPSAHYMMGGIRVDENCRSIGGSKGLKNDGILGLFAAGQAMGGLFGANRLGSTSLTEGAVFGQRAGKNAAHHARNISGMNPLNKKLFMEKAKKVNSLIGQKGHLHASRIKLSVQKKCWENLGPIRDEARLNKTKLFISKTRKKLKNVKISNSTKWNQGLIEYLELENMIDTAELMAIAALERNGSLGGHVRADCPNISLFSKPYSTIVRFVNNGVNVTRLPRQQTEFKKLIKFKFEEQKKFLGAKILRLMPMILKDRVLEKRYKKIMNIQKPSITVQPGSVEAAFGDRKIL
jgi:succinate dehydrogenase/fumarate reductase flavoprotein subunit|tara:strand:+ start:489 stop:2444 length:1956 start_codon:yes stop_codon:yes gene_type:complete